MKPRLSCNTLCLFKPFFFPLPVTSETSKVDLEASKDERKAGALAVPACSPPECYLSRVTYLFRQHRMLSGLCHSKQGLREGAQS